MKLSMIQFFVLLLVPFSAQALVADDRVFDEIPSGATLTLKHNFVSTASSVHILAAPVSGPNNATLVDCKVNVLDREHGISFPAGSQFAVSSASIRNWLIAPELLLDPKHTNLIQLDIFPMNGHVNNFYITCYSWFNLQRRPDLTPSKNLSGAPTVRMVKKALSSTFDLSF